MTVKLGVCADISTLPKVLFCSRSGYSGVENVLFYTDNCRMSCGHAQPMAGEIIRHLNDDEVMFIRPIEPIYNIL